MTAYQNFATKFFAGAVSFSRAFFGVGTGSIVLDQVGCIGNEPRLFNCRRNALGIHDCSHFEDAGVRCPTPPTAREYKTYV